MAARSRNGASFVGCSRASSWRRPRAINLHCSLAVAQRDTDGIRWRHCDDSPGDAPGEEPSGEASGADESHNASVLVESADPWGILIANAEFTALSQSGFGPAYGNHTQIIVAAGNKGAVRVTNSAFWGPSIKNADVSGSGSVGFESCVFNAWNADNSGAASIHAHAGSTISVRGCEWQNAYAGAPQVLLDAGVKKAIVAENIIAGPQIITDNGALFKPVVVNNVPG